MLAGSVRRIEMVALRSSVMWRQTVLTYRLLVWGQSVVRVLQGSLVRGRNA